MTTQLQLRISPSLARLTWHTLCAIAVAGITLTPRESEAQGCAPDNYRFTYCDGTTKQNCPCAGGPCEWRGADSCLGEGNQIGIADSFYQQDCPSPCTVCDPPPPSSCGGCAVASCTERVRIRIEGGVVNADRYRDITPSTGCTLPAEKCDGIDNNCDGLIDEGPSSDPNIIGTKEGLACSQYNPTPECHDSACKCTPLHVGDPFNAATGNVFLRREDIDITSRLGTLEFLRTFNSSPFSPANGYAGMATLIDTPKPFGTGRGSAMEWTHNFYSFVLEGVSSHPNEIVVLAPDGRSLSFAAPTSGSSWATNKGYGRERLQVNSGNPRYVLHMDDGRRFEYGAKYRTANDGGSSCTSCGKYFMTKVYSATDSQNALATVTYSTPTPLNDGQCLRNPLI